MANLTESPIYEPGIFQLEKSTPPLGGAPVIDNGVPSAGHANAQAQQLANRTANHQVRLTQAETDIDTLQTQATDIDGRVDIIEAEISSGGSATVLAGSLANTSDPAKGAALVGFDSTTVREQLLQYRKLANYTSLRNYTGASQIVRITQSGLSGDFYLDSSDITTPDNGGTIIVSTNGARWKREFSLEVNSKWFGVVGGGVVDDSIALQLAFDSGAKVVNLGVSSAKITSSVSYKYAGQSLKGVGVAGSVLIASTGALDGLICQGLSSCSLENIKLAGSGNTAGSLLAVRDSTGFRLLGSRVEAGFNGVEFMRINNCAIDKSVIADLTGNFGVRFAGDSTFKSDVLNITNTIFSHSSNTTINCVHWQSYAHSMTMENVRIIKGGRGLFTENNSGVLSGTSYPSFLQTVACEFDFQQNECIRLDSMQDAWITNLYTHGSASKNNIYIGEQTKGVRLVIPRSASAFLNGIYFGGDAGQIVGGEFYSNSQASIGTYDGIYVASTTTGLVIGPVISGDANAGVTPRQGYGLNIQAGSSNVRFAADCDFSGNTVGSINAQSDVLYENGGTFRHTFKNQVGTHLSIGGSSTNTVNNLRIAGSATGVSIKLLVEGSDANISPEIVPKGTGALIVGARNYASDAAAATGGVPVGGLYHTSGALKVRIA